MKKLFASIVLIVSMLIVGDAYAQTTTSTSGICEFVRDLKDASTGTDVINIQTFLESKGHLVIPQGVAKGYFGQATKAALVKYQISKGISPASGYFGPLTRAKLKMECEPTTLPLPPTYTLTVKTEGKGTGTVSQTPEDGPSYIKLTATASRGSVFAGWKGDCTVSQQSKDSCYANIYSANKTVTAIFNPVVPPPAYTVTVVTDGTGKGTVEQSVNVKDSKIIDLKAISSKGSVFGGWKGCDKTTGVYCSVDISKGNKTVTATFITESVAPTYTLTVKTEGKGTGTVSQTPEDGPSYIKLTATASRGSVFAGWKGDCTVSQQSKDSCYANIYSANKTVTAIFNPVVPPPAYTVTVVTDGTGKGTVEQSVNVKDSKIIDLKAISSKGSVFGGWKGCDKTTGVYCSVDISKGNKTVTATFITESVAPTYTLTVKTEGKGTGTVSQTPEDGPSYIKLTATASRGSVFAGWKGDCTVSQQSKDSCYANIYSANKTVTAIFNPIPTLTVLTEGKGTGTVSQTPIDGPTYIKLTAMPSKGSVFGGWKGDCASSQSKDSCYVNIYTESKTAIAIFNPIISAVTTSPLSFANEVNSLSQDLELGMTNPTVQALQQYLNTNGYVVNEMVGQPGSIGYESDYFGEKTKQALIKFQTAKGITPAQGYFGAKTRGMMGI